MLFSRRSMRSAKLSCCYFIAGILFISRPKQLSFTVPPREAIIMDEFGQRLHGIIGPYNEGYPVTLICEGEGGDPPAEVTWWKDSILIDDSYKLTPQQFTRNELHFPVIRRTDLMTELTCQASNSNITSVTSSVILDLNLRPLDVKIQTANRPVSVEEEIELVCQSQGARPPAQITWWKGPEKLITVRESIVRENNLTISFLTYVPTIQDNGINLTCRADNPQVRESEMEDVWYLDVQYPPQVSISKTENRSVIETHNITIKCHVQANPFVTDVSWIFNGKLLFSNPAAGIMIKNYSLLLFPVKRRHEGYYQCRAKNNHGQGKSEYLFIKVYYSPKCKPIHPLVYGVLNNEVVNVVCEVDADPTEVKFEWAWNRSAWDIQPINTFTSNGTISTATIRPDTEFKYNILLCWASNSIGTQKEPCTFNIIPAGPPHPLENCAIMNQTVGCLVVHCTPGNDGGLPQIFHLEIFNKESKQTEANLTVSDSPLFTICNLPTSLLLIINVYSSNSKGRSKSVFLQTSMLSSHRNITEEVLISISSLVGIIIGILLVILLLSFAVVLLNKLRKNKRTKGRKFQEDLEKSETYLMKECTGRRLIESQGPDIIPEINYHQERSECATRKRVTDTDIPSTMAIGSLSLIKYNRCDPAQYGDEPNIVLATPGKFRMYQERKEEIEDTGVNVQTPLIDNVQLGVMHWKDEYKDVGVLSTPV